MVFIMVIEKSIEGISSFSKVLQLKIKKRISFVFRYIIILAVGIATYLVNIVIIIVISVCFSIIIIIISFSYLKPDNYYLIKELTS